MATYTARPRRGQRAQKAWDVLAARYPAMQPTVLVSRLENTLGWRWSMQFNSPDDKTVFWDSVSVAEIRNLVAVKKKAKRAPVSSGLEVVRKNPKSKNNQFETWLAMDPRVFQEQIEHEIALAAKPSAVDGENLSVDIVAGRRLQKDGCAGQV